MTAIAAGFPEWGPGPPDRSELMWRDPRRWFEVIYVIAAFAEIIGAF